LLFACALLCARRAAAAGSFVEIRIEGVINPLKERYVQGAIETAARENASFLLITIDTPGGLVSSLQQITTAITNSPLPVIGFVDPPGAQATSAGAFILLATDVAAMAPGTRVGAAHPVADGKPLEGAMDEKATNSLASLARALAERRKRPIAPAEAMVRESKSMTEKEAHAAGLVEILAVNRAHLLTQLDGRTLLFRGKELKIEARGLTPKILPMTRAERLLDTIADPTLASLLLSLGVLGILYELSSPGIGMGGLVGSICLLVGLLALSVLPLEFGGALLLVVGLVAMGLELKVPSHGLLAGGGLIAFVLGGLLLVDPSKYFGAAQRVDWRLFVPFVVSAAVGLLFLARLTKKALSAPLALGVETLVGKGGTAKTRFAAHGGAFAGSVFVDGALWQAAADEELLLDEAIVVTSVRRDPLRLLVKRVDVEAQKGSSQ
jgi:membrane-bound serine protease (ClpP class)